MSGSAGVVGLILLWIGYLHRTRRISWLGRAADSLGRLFNRPGWVALPVALFLATILTALLGFIWDVSLHIGNGRDEGPLANPAHYFILVGLFFLFTAGMAAIVLPLDEKPGAAAVRITRTWYAPVGGILIAGAGLYALIGFPLDDIWHRLFGQDVTLWGPTHLMLIGGAGLSLVGVLLLEFEGRRNRPDPSRPEGGWLIRAFAFGGLLIGLSVFQVEFDFGVEQFRLVLQPMLIVAAAAIALTAARMTLGPFSTLVVVAFAALVRGIVAWLVSGPIIDAPRTVFPLYLGAAIVVEVLALLPLTRRHPIWWGAMAGLGIATVGLLLESWWIDAMFVDAWPAGMRPELLAMAVPVGIAAGVVGALLAIVLRGERLPRPSLRRGLVTAAVLVAAAATANGLIIQVPRHAAAAVTLTESEPDNGRMVHAEIRLTPADLADANPEWVQILAWQGGVGSDSPGRGLVVDHLERLGPGHYRTTRPVPVHGTWKTVLRVQDGRVQTALPIYMAADPGIGAEEVPALESFHRDFVAEITVLQRERSFDHSTWLFTAAALVVLLCSLALIAALSWGAARINDRYLTAPAQAPDSVRSS
ncbi:hypothetical protein [Nocardia sp. NPDC050406]|uniref:hypothetical protein n=1 Tax=Nocardia sp. NPDC050406 TaxID=3364318 RepID=UPI0037BB84F2